MRVRLEQKKYQNDIWSRSGVFIVNSEHILQVFLVLLLLTLNKLMLAGLIVNSQCIHYKILCINLVFTRSAFNRNCFQASIYLLKFNSGNIRAMCKICSKLTIKTERHHWCRSGVFIFNFEQIAPSALVFPLLTLNKWIPAGFRWQQRDLNPQPLSS